MKNLYWSDRVYQVDLESHSEATGLSFGIAGAAFAALISIACIDERSQVLNWSAACFALTLPMALGHAMLGRFVKAGEWSTPTGRRLAFVTALSSHFLGFAALCLVAFHISRIAGATFLIGGGGVWFFGWLFSRSYSRTCALLDQRQQDHPELGPIQPPLE